MAARNPAFQTQNGPIMPIDYSKYPPDWKKIIVPRILARAGNKCEHCGLPNKSTVWAVTLYIKAALGGGRYANRSIWFRNKRDAERITHLAFGDIRRIRVILTIAHLNHDETNQDIADADLAALCQYCHLKYDAREKYERAYLGKKRG